MPIFAQASVTATFQAAEGRFRISEITENFSSQPMIPLEWVMVGTGLVMVAISGLSIHHWWRHRHLRSSPLLIFNRVAGRCELGLSDQWLLWRIARHQSLPTPLTLMLARSTLGHHGRAFVKSRAPWRRAPLMGRLEQIRRTLFADCPHQLPSQRLPDGA